MTPWFRFYGETLNDPKILKLSDNLYRIWVGVLCAASKNEGRLPPLEDLAFMLRMKPLKIAAALESLTKSGLIDQHETFLAPHNWHVRQYKSDVSTERVKRFRSGKRNVSVTPPDSETDSVAEATGANAPIDHRKRLFNEGLKKLSVLTGKGPDACRAFAGKCLQAAGDDAVTVMGLIEDAERNQVINPSAWIAARLKPVEIGNGKPKNGIIAAADDLCRKLASFDGPAGDVDELRSGEGETPPRLLS